jgi:T5SS/PEP-CTERM-associated repeat protein
MKKAISITALLVVISATAQAQYTGNNQTNIITGGVTSNWTGNYYVGTNYYNDVLLITNASVLKDSGGYIGYAVGANSNAALVTGAGSVWSNSSYLVVGSHGVGNQLTITNGGKAYNTEGYIGDYVGASNNMALVTGAGSVWFNSLGLYVGLHNGNGLTIADGGAVYNTVAVIGYYADARNATALITGAGSVWSNTSDLYVGLDGAGNQLTITNGGKVYSTLGYIGYATGASNNAVTVTGAGSVWSNTSDLYVGRGGAGNQLTITNGGKVYNTLGYIGYATGASNNAVTVTGAGSVWSNTSDLYVGRGGAGNKLTITNGGAVYARSVTLGANAVSSNNVLAISGGSSSLITTNTGYGILDVRRGAVTMDSGTLQAKEVLLTNGAAGTLRMSGGTLAANSITNGGSSNFVATGGTIQSLNTNATWSAALVLSNGTVTFHTQDVGGAARTNLVSGALSGNGGLRVAGSGMLTLSSANTYSGGTTVSNGTLALSGSGTIGTGAVDIKSNGTLNVSGKTTTFTLANAQNLTNSGAIQGGLIIRSDARVTGGGSYAGAVTNQSGGFLTPGGGGHTNHIASLMLEGGSINSFAIGPTWQTHDMSIVTNGLTGNGGHPLLQLDLSGYTQNMADSNNVIVLYQNIGSSVFDGTNDWFQLSDPGGLNDGWNLHNGTCIFVTGGNASQTNAFTMHYNYDVGTGTFTGNDIVLTVIPEPASALVMVLGCGLLVARRRWKKTINPHGR